MIIIIDEYSESNDVGIPEDCLYPNYEEFDGDEFEFDIWAISNESEFQNLRKFVWKIITRAVE